jgi:uncharacterized membrane protein
MAVAACGLSAIPALAFAETSTAGDAAAAGVAGLFFLVFGVIMTISYVIMPLFVIGAMVLWVFAIVDAATRNDWEYPNALQGRPSTNDKMMWLLVVILAGVVGAAVYYFVVMRPYPLKSVRARLTAQYPQYYAVQTAPYAPPTPSAPSAPPADASAATPADGPVADEPPVPEAPESV